MSENILEKIIKTKIEKIDVLKKSLKIDSLKNKIDENKSFIDFKEKIENNINNDKISIIAEIKKASPSAGIIIDDYDPVNIAQIYNDNKATCLSVLTEEDFFLGNLIHITKIKQKINLPILCKDFFVDIFQVHLAKSYGADAILIILAGISGDLANKLYDEALKLNMSVIVEVHTVEEAKKALNFAKKLKGLNFKLFATSGTAKYLNSNGINCKKINKVREGSPHIVESLNAKNIELVINTTEGSKSISDSYSLRRSALVNKIPYCTSLAAANACIEAINSLKNKKITVKAIQEL